MSAVSGTRVIDLLDGDWYAGGPYTDYAYRPNIPADPAIIGLDDPLHHVRRNLVSSSS
jgi:hypothetical protein